MSRGTELNMVLSTTFVVEECCVCGVAFAMTEATRDHAMKWKAQARFWCPNGHDQHYTGKTHAELLAEAKRKTASALEDARIARAEVAKARREAARLRKRAAGGVCPCCKRSFVQLARHMAGQHPGYST